MSDIKTIEINGVAYVRADQASQFAARTGESLYTLGRAVFIRSVTYHYIGRIVYLDDREMVLGDASWIGDSGRWHHALTTGELADVEPYPGLVSISRAAIVDVSPWLHDLPREVK
jgi:xanthine dehydrogenase molybdopterin-binding subunit B